MKIGDVEIPIVSTVIEVNSVDVDEIKNNDIDNVVVQHEPDMTQLEIAGFLNEIAHSQSLALEEQRKQVKTLRDTDFANNTVDFIHYNGWLQIDEVEVNEERQDSALLDEVVITAWFFPYPQFE